MIILKQPHKPTKYQTLATLSNEQFKRLTGVKRPTFDAMVEILVVAETAKKARGGRVSKLCIEDKLLMTLEYMREYRTYFHVAQNYGVSEGYAFKISRWVEDTLIRDKRFALPGRKELQKSNVQYEVVLVDAAESPVERPKKDKGGTTPARRSVTH